jgi:uncharacterized damage-inducible protein DinB
MGKDPHVSEYAMRYRVGVEDIEPNHYVAFVFNLPGCFNSAGTEAEAVNTVPEQIMAYYDWIIQHDPSLVVPTPSFSVEVAETFQALPSPSDPDYLVNAFFADDQRPLGYWDVVTAQRLLEWSRKDLFDIVQTIPSAQLHQPIPTEVRGSVAGILEHIAGAENWYLSHFELALDRTVLPNDPLERLMAVREHSHRQLMGDEHVHEDNGEQWSARKLVRRMLWHERDHTRHIKQICAAEGMT